MDRLEQIRERLDEVRGKRGRIDPTGNTWRDMAAWSALEIERLRKRAQRVEGAAWDAVNTGCECSEVEGELVALRKALRSRR